MKLSQTIPMPFVQCGDTRLVFGKNSEVIAVGSCLLLVKLGPTAFELRVVSPSDDKSNVILLAAFVDPDQVDAVERAIAASMALPKQKRPRKRKLTNDEASR